MRDYGFGTISADNILVLIADDHFLHRKGLIEFLKRYSVIKKCDEAENGVAAIEAFKRNPYDIIFLDLDMPEMSGVEVAKIIRKDYNSCRIIILTGQSKRSLVYEMLELGISAYLLKSYSEEKTRRAIEVVIKGGQYIPGDIEKQYLEFVKEKHTFFADKCIEPELSLKEKRVVLLMCQQLTSDQISSKLNISRTTVETHRKHIFKKLNVVNSVGVIIYAIRSGLFVP